MIIEFDTVRLSLKEEYQKDVNRELKGDMSISFENEEDYHARITIDMKRVSDFAEGKVWYNNNNFDCVYPLFNDGCVTIPLLCNYNTFKKAFEMMRDVNVQSIKIFE